MKLIDKDAVVAEIEKLRAKWFGINNDFADGQKGALTDVLSLIDTLGVKEVDLDFQMFAKEMDTVFNLPSSETKNTEEEPLNWEYAIAKHFFELGLKAQKGEEV